MSATRRSQNTIQNGTIKISIGLSRKMAGIGQHRPLHCPLSTTHRPLSLNRLQSNSVRRQLSMRFDARYNCFSIHERASSKRRATRPGVRRKEEPLNLRDYTDGELSTAGLL